MTTKSELIARLEELLQQPDVEQVHEQVDALKESYEAHISTAQQEVHAESAALVEEGEAPAAPTPEVAAIPVESAPLTDDEDRKFKQLIDSFNTKVTEIRKQRVKKEAENLAAKMAIMDELRTMISKSRGCTRNPFRCTKFAINELARRSRLASSRAAYCGVVS